MESGFVGKLNPATMKEVKRVLLEPEGWSTCDSICSDETYIYAGGYDYFADHPFIAKIDLATMTEVGRYEDLAGDTDSFLSVFCGVAGAGGYVYGVIGSNPGILIQIDMVTMTENNRATLGDACRTGCFDGTWIYCGEGVYGLGSSVEQIDPATLAVNNTWYGDGVLTCIGFDDTYIYAGAASGVNHGVAQIDPSDMSQVAFWDSGLEQLRWFMISGWNSGGFNPGMLYVLVGDQIDAHPIIVEINPATMTESNRWDGSAYTYGCDIYGVAFDGSHAYCMTFQAYAVVIQVETSTMTESGHYVGSTGYTGEYQLKALAVDPTPYIYFGGQFETIPVVGRSYGTQIG